jgi:Tol biopolymer transport system component
MAAPTLSPDRRWLLFVRSYEGQDSLEIVDTMEFWPQKLVSGDDFYMQPAWHPDGERIAWISWNHPNMPWDGTSLRIACLRFAEGSPPVLDEMLDVAGDENTSVFQPEFSPDGKYLAYVSDASGWWQLYLHDLANGEQRQLTFAEAEHGWPGWVQGLRTYAFSPDARSIFFTRFQNSQTSCGALTWTKERAAFRD